VVLSGLASFVTAFLLGERVTLARKAFGVEYPAMYDNAKPAFNAVQRGHQNMLETHYAQLWMMSLAGLKYPIPVAIAGLAYSAGRVLYAIGYSSDPKKRVYGTLLFGPAGLATILMTGAFGLSLLGYIN
jgi:glutathione S-transferase